MYPANFPALGRGPFLALRRVPLRGLTLFSCLDARKEARKEDSERKEPLLFSSDYLFSFLDERKEAKENQGIRDASQVFRDFQRAISFLDGKKRQEKKTVSG